MPWQRAISSQAPGAIVPRRAQNGDDHLAGDVSLFLVPDGVAHDDPETTLGWCDDQTELEFWLDLILDGLDTMRTSA
jgi:hypothetical protein